MRQRTILLFGLTVLVALMAVAVTLFQQLRVTSADSTAAQMVLRVTTGGTCDSPTSPTKCTVNPGARFKVAVAAANLPDPAGYIGIQTRLIYGSLVYKPTSQARTEITWPDSALPVRSPLAPTGTEGLVDHGSTSGLTPPFTPSTHAGTLVEVEFNCSASPSQFRLYVLPYHATNRPAGAGFKLLDPATGGPGATISSKIIGQEAVDEDGDTTAETVDVSARLTINCGAAPTATPVPTNTPTPRATPTPCPPEGCPTDTPTPTNTPTRTPTPRPTATPTPRPGLGDVDCVGGADSLDALFILWFGSEQIKELPCQENGDVNGDGTIDAEDANLVLQRHAGLISSFPV
jgi:hypothetical protein